MKQTVRPLTVEDRVRIELKAHRDANPGIPISISEVCRRSGVSRASLYEFHRPLLDEIRLGKKVATTKHQEGRQPVEKQTAQLAALSRRNAALLCLCLELKRELQLVRSRLEQVKAKKI